MRYLFWFQLVKEVFNLLIVVNNIEQHTQSINGGLSANFESRVKEIMSELLALELFLKASMIKANTQTIST